MLLCQNLAVVINITASLLLKTNKIMLPRFGDKAPLSRNGNKCEFKRSSDPKYAWKKNTVSQDLSTVCTFRRPKRWNIVSLAFTRLCFPKSSLFVYKVSLIGIHQDPQPFSCKVVQQKPFKVTPQSILILLAKRHFILQETNITYSHNKYLQ